MMRAQYDIAVIGGGLAGLTTAILLARQGHTVILFEKETYPFHKVCGEYISLESVDLLQSLGVPLTAWEVPVVNTLQLTSPNGNMLQEKLPLGGIGISRYRLDHNLVSIARSWNVDVVDGTKVMDVIFNNDLFTIIAEGITAQASVCCGAFGKRSNLDVKWRRDFIRQKVNALNNFIAVKYHVKLEHPRNVISLHNFSGGYCGLAPIEDGNTCMCYLTTASNLRMSGNNIGEMENNILSRNPFLRRAFIEADMLYRKPLTISQVSFERKEQVLDHMLFLGDAAGLITPLCGNGMSMALQAGRMASAIILRFLAGDINRSIMESMYAKEWRQTFAARLRAGRILQGLFGRPAVTNTIISLLKPFPSVTRSIIRQTHG